MRTNIPTLLLASLLGTYLDLFFIGKTLYTFPKRPLPHIFSFNILFTCVGLPLLTSFFLLLCNILSLSKKVILIFMLSMLMTVGERFSESIGYFAHSDSWNHLYSFIGYTFYLVFIYCFYQWSNDRDLPRA
ncbi:hypothetical protein I5776_10255 [Heyndrickxia vini]|uniref:Group-specific protein n=1 Tax=Heyndrickxia vini TaxID=1476025 RepID=A0ABX7E869_9BACI|nr:hypothetical protein I5776_10255 [Heyndrickxia vini]